MMVGQTISHYRIIEKLLSVCFQRFQCAEGLNSVLNMRV